MKPLMAEIRIALTVTFSLAVILCGVYPLVLWGFSQGGFRDKANGSLVIRKGTILGSSLLAQGFSGPRYFHPRPSAAGQGYDGTSSGGSNLGPLSRKLVETVGQRVKAYREENGLASGAPVPVDAVTASASGLDPHITVENALLQAGRVAKARGMSSELMRKMVEAHTEGRDLGGLGEPRVNVMMLNVDLDGMP
jgi:potassium-transporting ATPase KdpC subunit